MEVKRVDVLGRKYKISSKPPKKHPHLPMEYMGLCMDDIAQIYLNPNLREGEEYWTTLFHEIGHAIMYRNGVRFSGAIPLELEEIIVETMASGYYSLMKQMFKEMMKDDDGTSDLYRDKILSFARETR